MEDGTNAIRRSDPHSTLRRGRGHERPSHESHFDGAQAEAGAHDGRSDSNSHHRGHHYKQIKDAAGTGSFRSKLSSAMKSFTNRRSRSRSRDTKRSPMSAGRQSVKSSPSAAHGGAHKGGRIDPRPPRQPSTASTDRRSSIESSHDEASLGDVSVDGHITDESKAFAKIPAIDSQASIILRECASIQVCEVDDVRNLATASYCVCCCCMCPFDI